jgi:hypothetical protein
MMAGFQPLKEVTRGFPLRSLLLRPANVALNHSLRQGEALQEDASFEADAEQSLVDQGRILKSLVDRAVAISRTNATLTHENSLLTQRVAQLELQLQVPCAAALSS